MESRGTVEVQQYIQMMVDNEIDHGLSVTHQEELISMVRKIADIFRNRIGADPPFHIPPMKVQ